MASTTESHQALPSTRRFLASLISSIAHYTDPGDSEPSNPLSGTNPKAKNALLALHALYPNELLPALDLLDRALVARLHLAPPPPAGSTDTASDPSITNPSTTTTTTTSRPGTSPNASARETAAIYAVRSTQQAPAHSRSKHPALNPTVYIVHLRAWSCSCPAFAFSAFPANLADSPAAAPAELEAGIGDMGDGWRFGGLTVGADGHAPACKHLLACVLAEQGRGFEHLVEEREVSGEEVAGWAAGWGD